jgi:hypothetical protein
MRQLIAVVACLLASFASTAKPPNILLIFADDIGYEALNCYGGQKACCKTCGVASKVDKMPAWNGGRILPRKKIGQYRIGVFGGR